jgi:hypothetical protein
MTEHCFLHVWKLGFCDQAAPVVDFLLWPHIIGKGWGIRAPLPIHEPTLMTASSLSRACLLISSLRWLQIQQIDCGAPVHCGGVIREGQSSFLSERSTPGKLFLSAPRWDPELMCYMLVLGLENDQAVWTTGAHLYPMFSRDMWFPVCW